MSKRTSLDEILNEFKVSSAIEKQGETTLTLWVPHELKARYKRIQQSSGKRFSSALREIVEAAIEMAEKKTT